MWTLSCSGVADRRPHRLAEIHDENLDGGAETFPHIYGPLNLDAVIEVLPFSAGPDGRFAAPGVTPV